MNICKKICCCLFSRNNSIDSSDIKSSTEYSDLFTYDSRYDFETEKSNSTKKMQQQDVFLGFKTQSSISRQETAKFCSEKDNIDLLGSNIDKTV